MVLSSTEVASLCRESMETVQLGIDDKSKQDGKDFYKYFFTNFPDLRVYFKGAEKFTADDVQKSERFEKQGARIQLAVYVLVNTFGDEKAFRAYARETVNRHRQFKMDPALWAAFFAVYTGFLNERKPLTDKQREAWSQLAKVFDEECQDHLKNSGLPHVE